MSRTVLRSFICAGFLIMSAGGGVLPAEPATKAAAADSAAAPVSSSTATSAAASIAAPAGAPKPPVVSSQPVTPVPLESFGKLLWKSRVVVGPHQDVCIGDLFFGPGVPIEFGIVEGRRHDRLYFRTDRKIVREWEYPVFGQPENAMKWAKQLVAVFALEDSLFVEMHGTGEPALTTGQKAARMGSLFRHWVAESVTEADYKEAAALGVPTERLTGPPPERICPLPGGG